MSRNAKYDQMLPLGTMLRGTYRIARYLASGGFGNTYAATDARGRLVAVKEFFMRGISKREAGKTAVSVGLPSNRARFEEQKAKFQKEACRLRRLKSPYIVGVHDLFEENGTAYYVMDYIDGENLGQRLRRTKQPLPEVEVRSILRQVLSALRVMHGVKPTALLHLDLKPDNIMVDALGRVRLIDFGSSKQFAGDAQVTTATAVTYTKGYGPREQMEQNVAKLGPWTDFYALGATLYKLLTNAPAIPLPSDLDDDHTSDKHLALPMPPGVSGQMQHLIRWLMQTDRALRPGSVAQIEDFLALPSEAWQEEAATSPAHPFPSDLPTDEEETLLRRPAGSALSSGQMDDYFAPSSDTGREDAARPPVHDVHTDWAKEAEELSIPRSVAPSNREEVPPSPPKRKRPARRRRRRLGRVALCVVLLGAGIAGARFFTSPFGGHKVAEAAYRLPAGSAVSNSIEAKTLTATQPESVINDTVRIFGVLSLYTGTVDADGLPHGSGTARSISGKKEDYASYTGHFRHGKLHGEGMQTWRDGTTFKGTFKDNYFAEGTYRQPDGIYYKGTFRVRNGAPEPAVGLWYSRGGRVIEVTRE